MFILIKKYYKLKFSKCLISYKRKCIHVQNIIIHTNVMFDHIDTFHYLIRSLVIMKRIKYVSHKNLKNSGGLILW